MTQTPATRGQALFDLGAHQVWRLGPEAAPLVHGLGARCPDYLEAHYGAPADTAHLVRELLSDLPPGRTLGDKFSLGVFDAGRRLVGALDVVRDYPEPREWYLGVLVLAPEHRQHGLGAILRQAVKGWARREGAAGLRLAVAEHNTRARRFWSREGFTPVSQVRAEFGTRQSVFHILRTSLHAMKCPECKHEMVEQSFAGRDRKPIAVDVCYACRGMWFDTFESLQLSAGGTLKLFREMHGHRGERRPRGPGPRSCPRCDQKLKPAQDYAHNQRFASWRCVQDHGHFITFFQFLREKGIVRELKPHELVELRKHVDTLLCSDCGEPVRLANMRACARCEAPLSLLDPKCVEHTVRDAQHDAGSRRDVAPEVAARLLMGHMKTRDFHPKPSSIAQSSAPLAALSASAPPPDASSATWGWDLVEGGVELFVDLIGDIIPDLDLF